MNGCWPGVSTRTCSAAGSRPPRNWRNPLGGRPALLTTFDHSALATARALEIAGVDGPRRFAERAHVVCDDAGRPTGLLLEAAAIDLVRQVVPLAPVAERRDALHTLLSTMAATGLTGGHVMDMLSDTAALVTTPTDKPDRMMVGVTYAASEQIFIAIRHVRIETTVKHEMMHQLLYWWG